MKLGKYLGLGTLIFTLSSFAHAEFTCMADLGLLEAGVFMKVHVTNETQNQFSAEVSGKVGSVTLKDAPITYYPIRPGADFSDVSIASNLNYGEKTLGLLYTNKELVKIDVPSLIKNTVQAKIYDLTGEQTTGKDPFGKTTLIEYFDSKGRSLGRFYQLILINSCN